MSSISRITKKRLFEDEEIFSELLPFAKYDEEQQVFVHSDASLWSIWELQPKSIIKVSDADAFSTSKDIQELVDSLECDISLQFSWITTFDVDALLRDSLVSYPNAGPAGWMARRWIRMLKAASESANIYRRPRKTRLICAFRYDPAWKSRSLVQEMIQGFKLIFRGLDKKTTEERRAEYLGYATTFRGTVEGKVSKLSDIGLTPSRIDGQGIINILYPILNRKSVKTTKLKKGRSAQVPVPTYDATDWLFNQISETPVTHEKNGIIKKDGRVFRTVSMAKPPKDLQPLMVAPLQSTPYENILTVTFSKDDEQKQIRNMEWLDKTLSFREFGPRGRGNQKVQTQVSSVKSALQDLYERRCQIVRVGVHQTFICQTEEEAMRAASEAVATFPQLSGARGMVHEVSDMGALINSLPGCYDPMTDGPGWTNYHRSSLGVNLFPLYGNWKGSEHKQFVLPSLWNRELVGFDLFDSNTAPNVLISGVSGAGKSYLLCYLLITLNRGHFSRTTLGAMEERIPITFVFDKGMSGQPCGFEKVAKLFGGRVYEATPSKAPAMNFLQRLGGTPPDPRNEDYKDLLDMCADIICDMATEGNQTFDRLDKTAVMECVVESHRLYRAGPMQRELILSDVVSMLRAPRRVDESEDNCRRRQKICSLISEYYGEGTYARFFDRPGGLKLKERFIVFDLKALSRNPDLQRVFLKVAMMWADTVMNDPTELDNRKVLVFDEAHDLIGKTSANTIETAFRLYRKRKGIVIAASQSGEDFYTGAGGQAIVQNSAHKIFLKQDPSKFHQTAKAFNLSDQQQHVILQLKTIKGIESQFYLLSDIGEGALCLPIEPAFYWVSTNNGDDNQFFSDLVNQCGGNFWMALERAVYMAPNGAGALEPEPMMGVVNSSV